MVENFPSRQFLVEHVVDGAPGRATSAPHQQNRSIRPRLW